MKIELHGQWDASCEVTVIYKGHTLKGQWSTEWGYNSFIGRDCLPLPSELTGEDIDALYEALNAAPGPVLRFENGTKDLTVEV